MISGSTSISHPSIMTMSGERGLSWNPLTSVFGIGSSFQVFPLRTFRAVDCVTPKDLASEGRKRGLGPIAAYAARISRTSSQVSFAVRLFSPLGPRLTFRPLTIISTLLSACVPANRWLGRTQLGWSQWWQTHKPGGIGPRKAIHAARCARIWPLSTPIFPYPCLLSVPIHNQQPEFGSGHEPSLTRCCNNFRSVKLRVCDICKLTSPIEH